MCHQLEGAGDHTEYRSWRAITVRPLSLVEYESWNAGWWDELTHCIPIVDNPSVICGDMVGVQAGYRYAICLLHFMERVIGHQVSQNKCGFDVPDLCSPDFHPQRLVHRSCQLADTKAHMRGQIVCDP
eukprot:SAG31_NODE_2021_length_6647_cov_2.271839_3_plen_128_part_00